MGCGASKEKASKEQTTEGKLSNKEGVNLF
jgi:hypothetical protein